MTLPDCDCGESATLLLSEPWGFGGFQLVSLCAECAESRTRRDDNGPPDAGEDDGPLSLDEQHRQAHAMKREGTR